MTTWTVRLVLAAWVGLIPAVVYAQSAPSAEPAGPSDTPRAVADEPSGGVSRTLTWLAGGLSGLALHEAGHVAMAGAVGASPRIDGIKAGPVPFFAIAHDAVGKRQEYAVSAAGFWVQHASAEWILTRRPTLRHERAPFEKGILAFHLVTSTVYGIAGLAHVGPVERDTRGMAVSLGRSGVSEGAVGALIWAPAALDAYRYLRPGSTWAKWASRGLKVAAVVLVAAAGSD